MKKNLLLLTVLILISSFIFTACGSNGNTLEAVKSAKKFRVGLDDTFAPMGYRDPESNELVGFDIDFARAVAKKMNLDEPEFVPTDWDGVFAALKANKFDVIINGLSISEDREKLCDFSEPYMNNRQIVIVKEDSNININSAEELKGKSIGVQKGSTSYEAIKKVGLTDNAQEYETNYLVFEEVKNGRVDCAVTDEIYAKSYNTQNGGIKILDVSLQSEPYAVGYRKGDSEFQAAFNKAIKELKEDGTLAEISQKWFGDDIIAK